MKIDLTASQEARLATKVAEGDDDLAWAKPLVDEAHAQVERGETISLEAWKAHNRARSPPSED
jgi:hypothetical protein